MRKNDHRFPMNMRRSHLKSETRSFHRTTKDPKRTAEARMRAITRRQERKLKYVQPTNA